MPYHDQVDAEPARAHVRALLNGGMTITQIQFASGVNRTSIRVMLGQFPGRTASRQIRADTAARLMRTRLNRGSSIDGLVPSAGTIRRLHALVAIGYPMRDLARRLGSTHPAVQVARRSMMTAAAAQAVMAIYDELADTPGPSTRAREYARNRGWLAPSWWDDDTIDDPLTEPDGIRTYDDHDRLVDDVTLPRAVRVDLMTHAGMSTAAIAELIGTQNRYVLRDRLDGAA